MFKHALKTAGIAVALFIPLVTITPSIEAATAPAITMSFTGDILLDKNVGEQVTKYGVNYPFTSVGSILKSTDLTAGNLETAVTTRGSAQAKQFTFRSKPTTLQGLKNNGFDMVSIANNHTMDYGLQGLYDTITYLNRYGIGHSGGGKNEQEAFKAYYKTVKGKKIAILAVSRVLPDASWFSGKTKPGIASAYQTSTLMSYVKQAVRNSDYTVVMIHWNKESTDYPESYARALGKQLVDQGVDAVIGSHSHTLMGMEYYKQVPIFYSLGNFVFTPSKSPKGAETMIVKLKITGGKTYPQIIPAKIINGKPTLMNAAYNKTIISKLNRLSYNASVSASGIVTQK
ncbi:CapA family protein [Priestia koreensis]|uniref:Capsule biosynthesis protein n=1 Tax=Priestia koreensis TaxID=284581 RepID=A0A0M0L6S8_9BACI|nr:CapA family protein [Priestia koreensis]KOO46373.1 capsule biosynthesis protein [Priestia koreensis]